MDIAKFNLESRKDKEGNPLTKNVPIRMSFHFDGQRLEYYTGIRMTSTKNFNRDYAKTGKVPIKANEPEAARKNKKLKELRSAVETLYDNAPALGIKPTVEYLREKLDELFKEKAKKGELLVRDAFQEYLTYAKQNKSPLTYKKFNTTYKHLVAVFGKAISKLTFDKIDTAFIEKFRQGLINQGYSEGDVKKEYLNNTVVKYLKSFKEFLNWCKDEKRAYYTGTAKFENLKENEIDVIYLDQMQLSKFITAEMPNDKLEKVKDVFLFGWYTGMRYQDLKNLKKVNVGDGVIKFYISKGTHTVSHQVPLVKEAATILKKYKADQSKMALPVFSNAKMNEYLKEAVKHAGINDIVSIRELKADGSFETKEIEMWELVTCHTSRKSFITFAVENGMEEPYIKAITGHSKNSRAFTRYYEVSAQKKKNEMNKIFGGKSFNPKLKAV